MMKARIKVDPILLRIHLALAQLILAGVVYQKKDGRYALRKTKKSVARKPVRGKNQKS
jgi:hypothetical protein